MKRIQHPVCIRCGDTYLFTNSYKGNYCRDCHDEWSSRETSDESRPRPIRPRTTSSVRRIEDDDESAPSRYDNE
ncbi:hypothetical protein GL213_13320 [Halogeometricum borinquense]|uniref:Small CPxCG-related zinc finger protein n=2 Tax=Halogeometricum borinquense TaxID=60847 RepID=E4NTT0_HALBP|nr:hypothetical protein [Halogeometricum borinquense]ADQ68235.1 hypothetical protein Hbor_26870 [Halogeometricum borinquense DSM 11551]ELY24721.1 hypothetical protein C499_15025 [Halogeometricum borinquense DSM 11551]QIB73184.1 hypothetical protein G3I44_02125 [Halogeometricum borinquense]QIQ77420.1 hypothetical protein GL213_13320 [Halogeometricum borinquense]RYJ12870.1 hypothetical protein ELS19_02050 [Halogeometricum borinquense]